jgi:hypothetical protein
MNKNQNAIIFKSVPEILDEGQIKHLEWIYNRMVNVHNENPNYDYMIRFEEIIEELKKYK